MHKCSLVSEFHPKSSGETIPTKPFRSYSSQISGARLSICLGAESTLTLGARQLEFLPQSVSKCRLKTDNPRKFASDASLEKASVVEVLNVIAVVQSCGGSTIP